MHNHVWPESLAAKALSSNVSEMRLFGDGTVPGLRDAQLAAGIDYSVCLAVANTPSQLPAANAFVGSLDREHFIPFGTVHPTLSPEANLESLRMNRLRGVKLHPVFQGYALDDPALLQLLARLEGEFCVVVHVGAGGGSNGENCTPTMARRIIERLPHLDLILCHFGGYQQFDDAQDQLHGLQVTLDTSWPPTLASLDPVRVRDAIRRHGPDRIVFGSDWPTAEPATELAAIEALGLDNEELSAVTGGNAARLLNLQSNGD